MSAIKFFRFIGGARRNIFSPNYSEGKYNPNWLNKYRTYPGKLRNPVSRRYLYVKTMIYCRNSVSLRKS